MNININELLEDIVTVGMQKEYDGLCVYGGEEYENCNICEIPLDTRTVNALIRMIAPEVCIEQNDMTQTAFATLIREKKMEAISIQDAINCLFKKKIRGLGEGSLSQSRLAFLKWHINNNMINGRKPLAGIELYRRAYDTV